PGTGTGLDIAVARYTADGRLDTTFNHTGTLAVDFGGSDDTGGGVAVQPDGKGVVVGTTFQAGANAWALARVHAGGTPDGSFGTGGEVVTDFGPDFNTDFGVGSGASGVVLLSGGQIVVGGTATGPSGNTDLAAARYSSHGVLDTTFGAGGLALADFAG